MCYVIVVETYCTFIVLNPSFFLVCLSVLFAAFSAQALIGVPWQMQLGNPSGATADSANHQHFLVQRATLVMDYNDTTGQPNWVSWSLTSGDANGAVPRQNSFAADTNLPASFHRVGPNEYAFSGYDRGHLCDSADRTDTTNHNDETFLMSNMMPQAPDNNQVTWSGFEGYCRNLADAGNEVLIICGPSGFSGARINTNGYVWIPQFTWKIAVVASLGTGSATNRISATNRVIAIKVPNTNGVLSAWQNYVTSVNQIQVDTGLTFFTALAPEIASVLRGKVDGQTNPPPAIVAFSPTNGAAGVPVTITGTNFSGATAVAFNGIPSTFTINSSNQLTAIVPTNASSGTISVTTPSGTAISGNAFSFIGSGGGVIYSGVLAGWKMAGLTNYGPATFSATTNIANAALSTLSRGLGVKQSGNAAANGWGGTGFTNSSSAGAIASNQFATFNVGVSNGYKMSISSISRFDYYRSGTGATSGLLQFQIGNGVFVDITNLSYTAVSAATSLDPIDLSGIGALQNVGANTNITFRIVNYGGTSASGTWYIYNAGDNLDLAVSGTVTEIVTPTNPPSITTVAWVNGNFQLTISGNAGASYTIYAATNLANPQWVPLLTTNPAVVPFIFNDSAVLPQRFYRVATP